MIPTDLQFENLGRREGSRKSGWLWGFQERERENNGGGGSENLPTSPWGFLLAGSQVSGFPKYCDAIGILKNTSDARFFCMLRICYHIHTRKEMESSLSVCVGAKRYVEIREMGNKLHRCEAIKLEDCFRG